MYPSLKIDLTGRTCKMACVSHDFWLLGAVYDGDRRCAPSEVRDRLFECDDRESMSRMLRRFGGFFSIVFRHTDGRVFAVTDRGRTHPLLYVRRSGQFIISDAPEKLLEALPVRMLDPLAAEEFATAGFVSGGRTLIEGVESMGPATILQIDSDGAVASVCYRDFVPNLADGDSEDMEECAAKLEEALRRTVDRLISFAGGRTLILPLSGGVDSRALLAFLLSSGYEKIKTFTFGRATSRDYRVGLSLAKAGKVAFRAVPYTRLRWRAVWHDPHFEDYLAHAHGLTSVPNLQAVPALLELRRSGWIEADAVFVPAFAGFFPGGCLPSAATVERLVSDLSATNLDGFDEFLMKRHFRTSDLERIAPAVRERVAGQLRALRTSHPTFAESNPSERVILLSEAFEYHERQAKFIGNACRYFDSFGYDWWLPMWDVDFVDVCESLPLNWRRDKSLLKMLTHRFERRYPQMVGAPPPFIVNGGFVKNQRLRALVGYFLDPFGQFAVVPFVDWLARVYGRSPSGGTVIDVLSQRCLRSLGPALGRSTA